MYYEKLLDAKRNLVASDNLRVYHTNLKNQVKETLQIAYKARKQGYDPSKEVEIFIAEDVASRTEGLVGPENISNRFKVLEEQNLAKDEVVVKIAKEIAQGKFGKGSPEELADQALRTALSYQTEGITAAPIEGIAKIRIKNNPDGTQYLAVYYAGPIRSAGGTAQGASVYLADVIRKELKLSPYKATEEEVERMLEEVRLYNQIMHLQLPTSDDEIRHAWRNLPIMIQGEPTEREEVSGYRNIDSMDTNRVRGGACLVLNDGLVGRAKKITQRIKKLNIPDWEWLEEIANGKFTDKRSSEETKGEKSTEVKPDYSFASDALMGRPTFADATAHGGWRLRYGHSRNTGIAAIGIHPGIMSVVNDFLAPGTHIRTERPGKGSIVVPVDTVKPPQVLLENGDLIEVDSYQKGIEIREKISQIVFMGDLLIGFGEFLQNNYHLCPVGYCEEWWAQEMIEAGWEKIPEKDPINYFSEISYNPPTAKEAIELAKKYNVALHPNYTPAWKYISLEEIKRLHEELWKGNGILPPSVKPILEKAFIPHRVVIKGLDVEDMWEPLCIQLPENADINEEYSDSLELINSLSDVIVKDTMGTTIGARMGRPEKSKPREMSPKLHGLFPVGSSKKIKRNLGKALDIGEIKIYLADRYCHKCEKQQWQTYCQDCGNETKLKGKCSNRRCGATMDEAPCDYCGSPFVRFTTTYDIDVINFINPIRAKLGSFDESGVQLQKNIDSPTGTAELIEKGILRAKYNLQVFRDGTIRYDATDAPLTHFYPNEIGVSPQRLNELGYEYDLYGNKLNSIDQLVELKPQDIIVHESSKEHFTKVSKFVDEELTKIYGLDPFYNVDNGQDLIGQLVIGLAPHTSAGVIGRIIGFTRSSLCWAHPYWHASKRRNCDGDEDGLILLMDGFLNFSKMYLPNSRGSKMDTPLVLVVTLNPSEVDDEAFNVDCVTHYPLELYKSAQRLQKPQKISNLVHRIENRLGSEEQFEGFVFSHLTSNIAEGPLTSKYKDANLNIRDKLEEQLKLAKIIRAVDERETALRILEKHVLPDLMGNLRAFASQRVRCVTCNQKYRRIPLSGKCTNAMCQKSNLILTVFPNSVKKYYDICEELIQNYDLGVYHEDRLAKLKLALDSHFQEEADEEDLQLDLNEWF